MQTLTIFKQTKPLLQWLREYPDINSNTVRVRLSKRKAGILTGTDEEMLFGKRFRIVKDAPDIVNPIVDAVLPALVRELKPILYREILTRLPATPNNNVYVRGHDLFVSPINSTLGEYIDRGNSTINLMKRTDLFVQEKAVFLESLDIEVENQSNILTKYELAQCLTVEQ